MTRDDYTDITIVLDRSGSMQSVKSDTEGGFNAFIESQRQAPGQTLVTLVQFDDRYEVVYQGQAIKDVPSCRLEPRGTTALLDALGKTIIVTGERLGAMPESERPGRVIVVVLTDGLENASKEWTREQVFEHVTRQTNDYAWTFTYLGAGQDAIAVGRGLGVADYMSLTYDTSNTAETFAAVSANVSRVRSGDLKGYTEDERRNVRK